MAEEKKNCKESKKKKSENQIEPTNMTTEKYVAKNKIYMYIEECLRVNLRQTTVKWKTFSAYTYRYFLFFFCDWSFSCFWILSVASFLLVGVLFFYSFFSFAGVFFSVSLCVCVRGWFFLSSHFLCVCVCADCCL